LSKLSAVRATVILGASLVLVPIAQPADALESIQGCRPPWGIVPTPDPPESISYTLSGIGTSSRSNAWAVGYWHDHVQNRSGPLVEHWDGRRWTATELPNTSDHGQLREVAVVSRVDAWAVGHTQVNGEAMAPLIVRWDGATWTQVPSPNPDSYGTILYDVHATSPTDVWAVGYYSSVPDDGSERTLILHWDGSAWSIVPSPNQGSIGSYLEGVTALSSNDAWAVGWYFPGDIDAATLALNWDGASWTIVPTPNPGTGWNGFGDAAMLGADDVWAVGGYNQVGGLDGAPLVQHWDGTAWGVGAFPASRDGGLNDVVAVSGGKLIAVGADLAARSLTALWDGEQWRSIRSPNPGSANTLMAVAATSPTNVWAAGSDGDGSLTLHRCPF
jgi:hypothetical protein